MRECAKGLGPTWERVDDESASVLLWDKEWVARMWKWHSNWCILPYRFLFIWPIFGGYTPISVSMRRSCLQYIRLGGACVSRSATSDYLVALWMFQPWWVFRNWERASLLRAWYLARLSGNSDIFRSAPKSCESWSWHSPFRERDYLAEASKGSSPFTKKSVGGGGIENDDSKI